MDHERSPSGGTAQRFATCAALASPGGPRCAEPTTRLLILTCAAEHGKLAGSCEVHATIAQELTQPGALSVCGLCEDLTGSTPAMVIGSAVP